MSSLSPLLRGRRGLGDVLRCFPLKNWDNIWYIVSLPLKNGSVGDILYHFSSYKDGQRDVLHHFPFYEECMQYTTSFLSLEEELKNEVKVFIYKIQKRTNGVQCQKQDRGHIITAIYLSILILLIQP